jgi:tetratricopeptide (TPR) repeat protein
MVSNPEIRKNSREGLSSPPASLLCPGAVQELALKTVFGPTHAANSRTGNLMDNTVKSPKPPLPPVDMETSLVEWFTDDFYPRYSKQIWVVAGTVIAAVAVYFIYTSTAESRAMEANRDLGPVYVLLSEQRLPEAEQALTEFLRKGPTALARDKANLFLGKVYYEGQKYDQAIEAYGKVEAGNDESTGLLYSGALHGLAASHMQKKDYAKAVEVLNDLMARFMRRTGDPAENLAGQEVLDLSPSLPNVLWKQALCYRELNQPEKAKAAVEKLRKAYPDSREAQDGLKLLAMLE